jgi:hypothetical protein
MPICKLCGREIKKMGYDLMATKWQSHEMLFYECIYCKGCGDKLIREYYIK